jgi:dihydrofolate synthase/folylpolyglutamate synthase
VSANDAVLDRLTRLHPRVIDLSLGRIERLLDRLGNPEQRLPPVIHVAGTNGKGSVIAYLRAMFEAAGHRVHVYTSPHLIRFNERIVLAGSAIKDAELEAMINACEAANGEAPITFFEITTAAAMLAFAETAADILLLETGLGGRLDATNVIARPRLTAITPISLDHQDFLGDTLSKIAAEKAAILKPGVPAVVAAQPAEAMACIGDQARSVGAPLLVQGKDWDVARREDGLTLLIANRQIAFPAPGLSGAHQVENATMAAVCALQFDEFDLGESAIGEGLTTAQWPGRLDQIDPASIGIDLPPNSEIWIDGGHNPAAGRALAATVSGWNDKPLHLIVGMLNSKDPGEFLGPLLPHAESAHAITIPGETNTLPPDDIVAAARSNGANTVVAQVGLDAALQDIAARGARAGRVLICGSLHLAGHVLARVEAFENERKTG